jgi:PKD repeat protein
MEDVAGFDTGGRSEAFPGVPAPKLAGGSAGSFAVDSVTSNSGPSMREGANEPVADDLGINIADRLIVRNVSMTIAIPEVSTALGDVTASAVGLGGWVVASIRTSDHAATISFRVPAERLDDAVAFLRDLATEVEAETSTSRDVTEEFVDLSARITNLEATEVQLRDLFERRGDIEQILAVQRELTKVRGDIERLIGQIRLLEDTAAFSLVTVILQADPSELATNAGLDRVLVEGETVRFRAEFTAPEGIEDFSYEWDFGDGTPVTRGFSTAPTDEGGKRTTATVVHSYHDERDSPFFATFTITGTGDAGIAEGEDTVQITVTSVPNIQVSAGENVTAAVGELVTFAGSFTRPEGVDDLKFRWDFGDGLAPFETDTSDDQTTIGAEHEYSIDRPGPYVVTLLVTGTTEHGAEVRAEDVIQVRVVPASVWSETVIDLGETARAATRALSATFQGAVGVGIWALIFSPAWVGAIALAVIFNRRRPRRAPRPPVEPGDGSVGDN